MASEFRPSSHLGYVDTLRGLAALYVVIHHAVPYIHRSTEGVVHLFLSGFTYGHYAVDIFITLSGFCLALPTVRSGGVLRGGAWGFIKRRARRILPPYYASMVFCLILIATLLGPGTGTNWDIAAKPTPSGIAAAALLLQDVFVWSVGGQINYPFWSVAIEWHIYFIFPIILWFGNRLGRTLILTLFILLPIAGAFLLRFTGWAWFYFQFLGLFTMGIAAAHATFSANPRIERLRRQIPWLLPTLACAACAVALCVLLPEARWTRSWAIADGFSGAATACALVYLGSHPHRQILRLSEWWPFVGLGKFSYSLYLMHAPVLQLVWLGLGKIYPSATSNVAFVFLAVPICVGFSWIFYRAFEEPFLRAPLPAIPAAAQGVS